MERIAIIGAGISGLSMAHLLKDNYDVTIFEKENTPGGLIRCSVIEGNLFHQCGGHVFNSKNQDVLTWFWSFFNKEKEFLKSDRNSVVIMEDGATIPYPIENHAYMFNDEMMKGFSKDIVELSKSQRKEPTNFEEFLLTRFGKTLYHHYFKPYNQKIWRRDLASVPLSWLEGKLPMPTVEEIVYNNLKRVKEKEFVHSSFWYEKRNGSQFIADRFAENLNIHYSANVNFINKEKNGWIIDGTFFEKVVFCGNIKSLPSILHGIDIDNYYYYIDSLESHGTTSVFCELEKNPYSWIYLPSNKYDAHRIICTGNFSINNNANNMFTGTVEFTDMVSKNNILENLSKMPLNPKYITHKYNPFTYPIQDMKTRDMIKSFKKELEKHEFYMTGRFADWEYYNMDVATEAAMRTRTYIK